MNLCMTISTKNITFRDFVKEFVVWHFFSDRLLYLHDFCCRVTMVKLQTSNMRLTAYDTFGF